MHYYKFLPCEGEVARSAETEGFPRSLSQVGKKRLGSAENPSVSLREPPSLGKGRSFIVINSPSFDLCIIICCGDPDAEGIIQPESLPISKTEFV